MATISSLVSKVASLMDVSVDTTSTPSQDQVTEWLKEGFRKLVNMLPDEQLTLESTTASGTTSSAVPTTGALKIVSVFVAGVPATKVSYEQLQEISSLQPSRFSGLKHCYAVASNNSISCFPQDGLTVQVRYIADPTTSISDGIAGLVVDYAVVMAKIQDEETEQANMLWQKWMQDVQVAAGGMPINKDGAL